MPPENVSKRDFANEMKSVGFEKAKHCLKSRWLLDVRTIAVFSRAKSKT